MNKSIDKNQLATKDNQLFQKVAELIELARQKVVTTVNFTMVHTYFEIGRMIVEDDQEGKTRAEYGKTQLRDLSIRLIGKFGKGFSEPNLRNMRKFFIVYTDRAIQQRPSTELQKKDNQLDRIWQQPSAKSPNFTLSWSHYLILMRIENSAERSFYEIEALQQNWSEALLKRQYHSSLYERLALSRNKDEVMKLANKGHIVTKAGDVIKNP